MEKFLSYESLNHNDRLFLFFAGHGATVTGARGPIGYLIPVDGKLTDKSTLIRWDELTHNADIIPAKHILFVMDACYSGLAIQRAASVGEKRFLTDMLRRRSRQVIAAGKADQTVADGGGPDGKNSIFTGYLLDGLAGRAADEHGVITASNLMNYAYRKVGTDPRSNQTPHFGHVDGDGDFILSIPADVKITVSPTDNFMLASIPDQPEQSELSIPAKVPQDALEAYFHALQLIRNNDRVAWRKLVAKAISTISPALIKWRQANGDKIPEKKDDLPDWVLPGLTAVSPVMAIALAGVESGEDYFRKQIGLIEEFLRPTNWELSGYALITRFPQLVAFVYQALLGSVAMQTDQAEIARRLAIVEISDYPGSSESRLLYQSTEFTGWPDSLGHHCSVAWKFLVQLPEHWSWLSEIFGDAEHFRAALCAHYALLNVIEFSEAVRENLDLSQPQRVVGSPGTELEFAL